MMSIEGPTVVKAKYTTRSEDPCLQELTECATRSEDSCLQEVTAKEWRHRNGYTFILGEQADEAWNVIFQCIICVFIQPSSLLFIEHHYNEKKKKENDKL